MKQHKTKKEKIRKIKIEMSVELSVPVISDGNKQEQFENIAGVYLSSLGDKDIKIENIYCLC